MAEATLVSVQTRRKRGSSFSESFGSPGTPPTTPSTDLSEESPPTFNTDNSAVVNPSSLSSSTRRKSRKNTHAEKRKMRNARNKRRRKGKRLQAMCSRIKTLEKDLNHAQSLVKSEQNQVKHFRHVSRTYWERWRWEVDQRRESMNSERRSRETTYTKWIPTEQHLLINHIDPELIKDAVVDGVPQEVYLGRGTFGIVRLQTYRGMDVAVKELLPRTAVVDLMHEANILASLSHPNLPYLFGVCTKVPPLRLVMQFHGFRPQMKSRCLLQELRQPTIPKDDSYWIFLLSHILEAACAILT